MSYFICLSSGEYPASLEPRKVYQALADKDAARMGLLRIVDESGEDYLFPRSQFAPVTLPAAARAAFLSKSQPPNR